MCLIIVNTHNADTCQRQLHAMPCLVIVGGSRGTVFNMIYHECKHYFDAICLFVKLNKVTPFEMYIYILIGKKISFYKQ